MLHSVHLKKHLVIYRSWRHVFATVLVLAIPFGYLVLFSQFAHLASDKLFSDTGISLYRMFVAYVLSAAIAWLLAIFTYHGRVANIALPIIDVLQSFPAFAALPLVVAAWGASDATIMLFIVLDVAWPIYFSTISSLKLVRHDWEEVAEIYGVTGVPYMRKFLLPLSLPGLITGSIVGLGDGWQALIATEIIVNTNHGLGNFFQTFSQNIPITVFGILGFLLIIFCLNRVVWLRLLGWSHRLMEE